jgi:lipopolysaccharide biosynthesis protein
MTRAAAVRLLAFYLPQYHPIPENDAWWGAGFTDWWNVRKARPLFPGHDQPREPADLGYYDLRDPAVRARQADLARAHGVDGFCYYHYWFLGRRLLERPFDEVLASGEPDFPFCLCWANEPWTRRWDGAAGDVLVPQGYSREDDLAHIRWLVRAFADRRYIKVDGRPLFLVYRSSRLPDPLATTGLWRERARQAGFPDLYLCRVESFPSERGDPRASGFDAAVEFQPRWSSLGPGLRRGPHWWLARALGWSHPVYGRHRIHRYATAVRWAARGRAPYPRFRCVMPGWDNSPRRPREAAIFVGATPEAYEAWLTEAIESTHPASPEENLVFVNAWNEWAEGAHLEPCRRWGREYLEATLSAVRRAGAERVPSGR